MWETRPASARAAKTLRAPLVAPQQQTPPSPPWWRSPPRDKATAHGRGAMDGCALRRRLRSSTGGAGALLPTHPSRPIDRQVVTSPSVGVDGARRVWPPTPLDAGGDALLPCRRYLHGWRCGDGDGLVSRLAHLVGAPLSPGTAAGVRRRWPARAPEVALLVSGWARTLTVSEGAGGRGPPRGHRLKRRRGPPQQYSARPAAVLEGGCSPARLATTTLDGRAWTHLPCIYLRHVSYLFSFFLLFSQMHLMWSKPTRRSRQGNKLSAIHPAGSSPSTNGKLTRTQTRFPPGYSCDHSHNLTEYIV